MSKESMKMNRRDFLGLGAVAAVGAMGLAGCAPQTSAEKDLSATGEAAATPEATAAAEDWLGAEPEIAEGDIVETLDTDFLILGAGRPALPLLVRRPIWASTLLPAIRAIRFLRRASTWAA